MTDAPQRVVRLNVNIDEKLHTAFKTIAAIQGRRMTDLLVELVEGYVREHMPPGLRRKGWQKK